MKAMALVGDAALRSPRELFTGTRVTVPLGLAIDMPAEQAVDELMTPRGRRDERWAAALTSTGYRARR